MNIDQALAQLGEINSNFQALSMTGVRPGRDAVHNFIKQKKAITDILRRASQSENAELARADKDQLRAGMHRLSGMLESMQQTSTASFEGVIDPLLHGSAMQDTQLFPAFSDYLTSVMRAGNPSIKSVDDRLLIGAAPSTFGSEGVGEDGGYLVPEETAREIFQYSLESNSLLPFCRTTPVGSNVMSFPVSEATPWGSSGVQVYWEGEGGQLTQSKPAFEGRELRLRKLTALVPITNELLEDQVALASWLPRELGNAARWAVNNAIVNGSGTGQPQGFTASGALVTQAKEGSQTADTINANNIARMYARCSNPSTAVWIINPDAFPQIPLMTIGNQPVWTPVNEGMKSSPGGMLLGRPVIFSDACQTLGDAGDIYFADLSSYAVIQKRQGARIDQSMHLWFDYDMTAFRLTLRIDGQSLMRTAVTPPNSTVTRSPFVRLAVRA